jgi:subtilisin family serine protease
VVRRGVLAAAVIAVFLTAAPVVAHASDSKTGRLLVTLKASQSNATAVDAVAARHDARVALPPVDEIHLAVLEPAAGQSVARLSAELRADPAVQAVRPERRMQPHFTPNDPAFLAQVPGTPIGTTEEWWATGSGLPDAWNISSGNGGLVAIIDTGVDAKHPEFKGRIKRKVDFDDDKHHKGAGYDEVGHGTHVASLACGRTNNRFGIAGAGRNCKLLIAKTDLSDGSVASSIIWAVRNHADAINMSFGSDTRAETRSPEIERAVRYAWRHGAVMVAAAADEPTTEQGDPGNLLQPTGTASKLNSSRNRGLTVTAAAADNQRASFAGHGTQISLAAYGTYGTAIGSPGLLGAFPAKKTELERGSFEPPVPSCGCRVNFNGDDRFARLQGTSMAAPIVSGIVALVRTTNPDLSNRQVIRLMKTSATRTGGWNADTGWGVVNANAAVLGALSIDATPPRSKIHKAKTGGTKVKLTWSGTDKGPKGVRRSGVAGYDLYRVSADGTVTRVAKSLDGTSKTVSAITGAGFYTRAVDGAGNRENKPKSPDVVVH